ncbi:MAG: carboxypeptidase-like regulatory domain-containing protein [Candidatus Eisenbacteria bacterium]
MRLPRLFPVIPVVLLSMLLLACSGNESGPVDPEDGPGVLRGQVTDGSDSPENLAGVTVRIEGTDRTTVTGADGSFVFDGLESGNVTVVVDAGAGSSYQSNRIEVSVHGGDTVRVDITVLPRDAVLGEFGIYPDGARVGILESAHFWAGGLYAMEDGSYPAIGYRPTWSIRSERPIGVISREGIFIGTAVGRGTIVASFRDDVRAEAPIEVVADGDVVRIELRPSWRFRIPAGGERYLAAWAVNGAGHVDADANLLWGVFPSGIGTIVAADDLPADERANILEWLLNEMWIDHGYPMGGGGGAVEGDFAGDPDDEGPGNPTDPVPPEGPVFPPFPVDPDAVRLARFTANPDISPEAEGSITVQAEGADWRTFVYVTVYDRGELTSADLRPEDALLTVGGGGYFFARGLNEWDRSMEDLEYEWSVTPADLGTIEPFAIPWMGPDGDWGDGDFGDDGFGEGGTTGPEPGQGGGGDPDMPRPPDGSPLPGPEGAWLRAENVGEGVVTVTITDVLSNNVIVKSVPVRIEPAPALSRVEIRPNPVEASAGDSAVVFAYAFDTRGDLMWGVDVEWELVGNIGALVPYEGPHFPDYDDSLDARPGGDPSGGSTPVPPIPDDGSGPAPVVFLGTVPGGEGTIRATAITADGVTATGEAVVRVRSDAP